MKKKRRGGPKVGGRWTYLMMEPALWRLLEKLQAVVNERLQEAGKPPLTPSGVLNLIVKNALLDNADDILHEDEELGLHRLAVRFAPVLGAEGLAASGLPAVAHVHRRGARRARAATH